MTSPEMSSAVSEPLPLALCASPATSNGRGREQLLREPVQGDREDVPGAGGELGLIGANLTQGFVRVDHANESGPRRAD